MEDFVGLEGKFQSRFAAQKDLRESVEDFAELKGQFFFSVGGKEILIKIMVQAIPNYIMSYF